MAEQFNAYHKWLAIPPDEQPPNHYRLLGVPVFESDLDVIESAADRQMGHLRGFAAGPYSDLSQQILNEIASAKISLLNPDRKAVYDTQLRAELAAAAPAPPTGPPTTAVAQPPTEAPQVGTPASPTLRTRPAAEPRHAQPAGALNIATDDQRVSSPRSRGRKRSRPGPPVGLIVIFGGAVLVAVFAIAKLAQQPAGSATAKKSVTKPKTGQSQRRSMDTNRFKDSSDATNFEGALPDFDTKPTVGTGRTLPSQNNPSRDAYSFQVGPPIDLLGQIDLTRDVVSGRDWRLGAGGLVVPNDDIARIQISADVPEAYLLKAQAERTSGQSNLALGLAAGEYQALIAIDAAADGNASIAMLVQGDATILAKKPGRRLAMNRTATIECRVVPGKISVRVDDQPVLEWSGDFSKLTVGSAWTVPNRRALIVGGDASSFRITRLELQRLDTAPEPDPIASKPKAAPTPPAARTKLPVPSDEELARGSEQVREIFEQEFRDARKPDEKFRLAKKLYDNARRTRNDPVGRYVLFHQSAELAASIGIAKATMQAIYALSQEYEIDDIAMRADLYMQVLKASRTPDQHKDLIPHLSVAVDDAVAADRYDEAGKMARIAISAASRTNDGELRKQVAEGKKRLDRFEAAYQKTVSHRQTLEENPNDPAAHLAIGEYYCFFKDDWKQGLSHLAQGGDAPLAQIAAIDRSNPTDDSAQLDLADKWWDYSESVAAQAKKQSQLRAALWYRLALPGSNGLTKTRIRKRLNDIQSAQAPGTSNNVYLDDLRAFDYKTRSGDIGTQGRSDRGNEVSIDGKTVQHALMTRPSSRDLAYVTYKLGAKFARFRAKVMLADESSEPRSPLTFKVYGDGQLLWSSRPIKRRTERVSESQLADVRVVGVDQLRLEVSCPDSDFGASAVWVYPQVFR